MKKVGIGILIAVIVIVGIVLGIKISKDGKKVNDNKNTSAAALVDEMPEVSDKKYTRPTNVKTDSEVKNAYEFDEQ